MSTGRDIKSDGLKLLLIFLVVLGHLSYYDFGLRINRVIYAFHMPAFVFLSGYFTSDKTPAKKLRIQLIKLFVIYAIAQVLHILMSPLVGESMDWTHGLIFPHFALWYLLSLIGWRVYVWALAGLKDLTLFVISIILAIASGYIPLGHELAFQRTFAFLPFFVVGFTVRRWSLADVLERQSTALLLSIFMAGLLVARLLPWTYMPKFPYENWHEPVIRAIQTTLGMVLTLSLFGLSRKINSPCCAGLGKYTLWVYIGHTYLIRLGEFHFPRHGISLTVVSAILLSALYCTAFLLMAKGFAQLQKNNN